MAFYESERVWANKSTEIAPGGKEKKKCNPENQCHCQWLAAGSKEVFHDGNVEPPATWILVSAGGVQSGKVTPSVMECLLPVFQHVVD